ncbi:MAG: hypothetical protein ABI440_08205 [Casimicrobiaceae bacterium]
MRYVHGAQVLEPYMEVHFDGPNPYLPLVRRGIVQRRGRTTGIDQHDGCFYLFAEAPLAALLGYADEVRESTSGRVTSRMRLNRYVPVDYNDPEAA